MIATLPPGERLAAGPAQAPDDKGSFASRLGRLREFLSALDSVPGCVILVIVAVPLFGFLMTGRGPLGRVLVVGFILLVMLIGVLGKSSLEIRMEELQDQTIEVDGNRMRASDENGDVVATIDLSAPFKVTVPYVGNGKGVYRVEQDGQRLEFSSTMDDAEHLVKGVLGLKSWPPDADIFW
jgi:hypothetical protein